MITLIVLLIAVAVMLAVLASDSWSDFWRAIPMIVVLELIGICVVLAAIGTGLYRLAMWIRSRYKPSLR